MANGRKLLRSKSKVVAGVLGGIADYFDIDPTAVRVVYALLTALTAFSGIIIYFILWLVMPEE
ncbi:MAG: PspC domain-containing protein [Prevotella sp.]|nr:PspC domain-containing protein [Prevotella sp.]